MPKIGWGKGIVIFFILYISYLVVTVIKSTQVHHSLVVDDYYQHDIDYQKMYVDPAENRNALTSDLKVNVNYEEQFVILEFGPIQRPLQGEILFYRPSDQALDVKKNFTVSADEDHVNISTEALMGGRWTVKVRWEDNDMSYYKEEDILI